MRFVAVPQPLLHELYRLGADCALVALRVIECAGWKPTTIDGIVLDTGECLVSQRSEHVWGDLEFGHNLSSDARRSLVRRALERLEKAGIISARKAHPAGPASGQTGKRSRGPSPTIVRVLKYRRTIWPSAEEVAQASEPAPAQHPAHPASPILPIGSPDLPAAAACGDADSAEAAKGERGVSEPHRTSTAALATSYPAVRQFQDALAAYLGNQRLKITSDPDKWAAMDAELRRVGLDAAVKACVERASRRSEALNAIGSLWWFLPCLSDLPGASPGSPGALAAPTGPEGADRECPVWRAVFSKLERSVHRDPFLSLFAPLKGFAQGDELVIVAPDHHHLEYLEDTNNLETLEKAVEAVTAERGTTGKVIRLLVADPPMTTSTMLTTRAAR
jgi:hypothetical protein